MEKFKVFSLKIATKLSKQGFDVVDYELNTKNPTKKVFVFEVKDGFFEAFEKFKNESVK